jgi:CBS domain-containing protein
MHKCCQERQQVDTLLHSNTAGAYMQAHCEERPTSFTLCGITRTVMPKNPHRAWRPAKLPTLRRLTAGIRVASVLTEREATVTIKELMTRPAVTCPNDSTLEHAAWLMWEFDCGMIPVVDAEGRAVGVITDRDVCMAAYTQGRALRDIPVATSMAHHVIAIHADESVETAEHLMADNQVRRLPVIDGDGKVVGVVSLNDLARLAGEFRRIGLDREFVATVAAVSRSRSQPPLDGQDHLVTLTQ